MTVKATVNSTLNTQSADLILIEDGDTRSHESKTLSGGTETFIFTELDGGSDKEYTAKIVPSTNDVTQTAQIGYDTEIRIDPIPHRDVDASQTIREDLEFGNGVATKELGLGDHTLVGGLLSAALNDGEVLSDDGYVYSSVQAAQDAASSWIFIGPGTFNESVTIDTPGLTVQGSGYNTFIDGGTTGHAISVTATDVVVIDLRLKTTANTNPDYHGLTSTADRTYVDNIAVDEADYRGITLQGNDSIVKNSYATNTDFTGIDIRGLRCISVNNTFDTGSSDGMSVTGDDGIIANCISINAGGNGINISANDCIAIGNRCNGSTDPSIHIGGGDTDNIIANNRVVNINNAGTGTLLDGNNTGGAN